FRRVYFGRKRIVDFVVKQIAALFANGNERFYRFVFFFKKNLRHKSSRSQQAFSGPSGRPENRQKRRLLKNFVVTHDGRDASAHVSGVLPVFTVEIFVKQSRACAAVFASSCVARIPQLLIWGPIPSR